MNGNVLRCQFRLGVFWLIAWMGLHAREAAPDPLSDFQAKYETAKAELLVPIEQLRSGYLDRLKAHLAAAQQDAALDRVQWILAEKSWVEGTDKMPPPPESVESAKARDLYLAAKKEREAQRVERLAVIIERSTPLLDTMQKDFTRDGRFDRAVAAREFATTIQAELKELRSRLETPGVAGVKEGEKVLWSLQGASDFKEVEGCEAKEGGGSWTLTSVPEQRGHIESRASFSPPFRITALVASESGDLRFYYGPATSMEFVLFNWTRNPTTLRLADPSGKEGIVSVPDRGFLTVGQTYLIEVLVEPGKIEVHVDGELRGSTVVDLRRMREPVGIGPFGTATLPGRMILEQFTVIGPEK